ncbi:hypothetical protein GO986_15850 [Deinococcus sp. HMF7620]|uniref:DUF4149 domain-containing protein n=1 Tax=Deinococcus arboris TaxID=2682977 RepID=A0A7C9MSP7_9DEIO|nr:hypothetical protein [Deinococcus arboris]MVN88224.1 hypothetical protein [Deinococcus arboris]
MSLFSHLNVLLVGAWFGMYLFTTFVVSPAFAQLFPDAAIRSAHRQVLGRQYARVNGPLTLALLLTLLALSLTQGFSAARLTQWGLLLSLSLLIPLHVRAASRRAAPPRWITHVTLLVGLGLCGAAVVA